MKQLLIACLLGSLAFSVQASDEHSGHKGHEAAQANASISQGEVRKIDAANQEITLRHGPLANIGMPPMTMVFQVQDAAQLEGLKVGDKVSFVAQQQGSQFVASELQAVQP
ncbi:MAG: copper-binding protein [Gammaproteobacteria bacterium]|nr:copper-binding protein [Gammaproteobacteria bacterium]MBU1492029.1 copper-binding protein [Gammaproteobacteria bacterium]MBU2065935.1 copper-binding protein [Gammaproteobacteria bacterium]MBU2141261.1 copper-binding protein [Gammaproteobacteria bacterium]MBU2215361.1 copper-binding protein [Gammaproteobacteria bacterium]